MKRLKIGIALVLVVLIQVSPNASLGVKANSSTVSGNEILETVERIEGIEEEIKRIKEMNGSALIEIEVPDENYNPIVIAVEDRSLLESLVMGEASGEGFEGAALVAQCIRDTMIKDNNFNTMSIKRNHGYSGSVKKEPSEEVKQAVAFIFDNGGYVVRHELSYFYAPKVCYSKFHESQEFVIEYGGHRFFEKAGE